MRPILHRVLTAEEQKVWEQLAAGYHDVPKSIRSAEHVACRQWGTWWPRQVADKLVDKGWARNSGSGRYIPIPYDADVAAKADWIWLPNALIDGAGDNLAAPVELVRQTRIVAVLQLLIDLYHSQNLASDGGIHWRIIRRNFVREKVGQHGPFIVYGFSPATLSAWGDKPLIRPHVTGKVAA